jgi:hypothetical protein
MPIISSLVLIATFAIAANGTVLAQTPEHKQGPLTVVQPWSRATAPSQKAGGVFLRIENTSDQPDRLTGVETEMANIASLHAMIRDGNVMKMRPVENGIDVPANGHVVLAPGGRHVMLIGLHNRLAKGTTVPLTLIFERAGRIEIEAVIEGAGSHGPASARASGDGHGSHAASAKSGN